MIHASDNTNAATVVQYNQIAGHTEAKRLLQEAIVMPMLVPELFNGIRQPWKGVLLFGKSWHMGHLLVVVGRVVFVVSLLLLLLLLLCRD
jgi:ATP-dependent 26S proteasome regulatory subunit